MKSILQKTVILAVAIAASAVTSGCNEQNLSDEKQCRLIANENRHLKKEVERQKKSHDMEIKEQKDLFVKEIQKQREHLGKQLEPLEKLLEDCLHQREILEERTPEDVRRQLDDVLKGVIEENENLKAQIAQLKEELKKPKP